jgi:hypothetical protein
VVRPAAPERIEALMDAATYRSRVGTA